MRVKVGETFQTRGGWAALVIWVCLDTPLEAGDIICVHCPGIPGREYAPVTHKPDGSAVPLLGVCNPPSYGQHPADLIMDGGW